MHSSTASSNRVAPPRTSRRALYPAPHSLPDDLDSARLTPNARLLLLIAWREWPLTEDCVDRAHVRRQSGLDAFSFASAELELRRGGFLLTAQEHRRGDPIPPHMALVP